MDVEDVETVLLSGARGAALAHARVPLVPFGLFDGGEVVRGVDVAGAEAAVGVPGEVGGAEEGFGFCSEFVGGAVGGRVGEAGAAAVGGWRGGLWRW